MKVLITGIDGYSGLASRAPSPGAGPRRSGIDNFVTRRASRRSAAGRRHRSNRGPSARPPFEKQVRPGRCSSTKGDLGEVGVRPGRSSSESAPTPIVHLAEQRSAPYSMIDVHHAVRTQVENITGTLHLLYAMQGGRAPTPTW